MYIWSRGPKLLSSVVGKDGHGALDGLCLADLVAVGDVGGQVGQIFLLVVFNRCLLGIAIAVRILIRSIKSLFLCEKPGEILRGILASEGLHQAQSFALWRRGRDLAIIAVLTLLRDREAIEGALVAY